jgi:predicted transcriptional regulator
MRKEKLPMSEVPRGRSRSRSVERRASTQGDQSPSSPRTKDFASKQGLEGPSEENPERLNRAIISTAEKYIDNFLGYAETHPESLAAALEAKGLDEEEFIRGRLPRAKKWIEDYNAGKITDQNEVGSRLSILSRSNDKHFPELEEKVQEVLTISTAEEYIDNFLGYAETHPESLTAALKAKGLNEEEFMARLTDDKKWIEDYNAGKITDQNEVGSRLSILSRSNDKHFPELEEKVHEVLITISTAEKYIDNFLGYAETHPESLAAALEADGRRSKKNQKEFMARLTDDKKWIEDYNAGKITDQNEVGSRLSILSRSNELFKKLEQQVQREITQEALTVKWDQAILQKQNLQFKLTEDWLSGASTLSDRENKDIRSYMQDVNDRISELAGLNQQDKSETSEITMQDHLFQINRALLEVKSTLDLGQSTLDLGQSTLDLGQSTLDLGQSTLDLGQERDGSITPRGT